ncbi:MAG TPA: hypothetical protein VK537_01930 [Galbitalea sp.]|nr:hypothetical protein [Galbitalea sp.]
MNESKQDVLGPDETVIEQASLFLSQDQYSTGAISESLEHPSRLARCLSRCRADSNGSRTSIGQSLTSALDDA